jgi:hypothetical protein
MRKLLLFTFVAFYFSSLTHAQIRKGSVLLGGSLSFSSGKNDINGIENKGTNVYISPSLGIAVRDNWVVGASAGFSSRIDKGNNTSWHVEEDGIQTGAFVRRYLQLSKSFYLYGEGNVRYSTFERNENSNTTELRNYKTKSISASVIPGITFAVSKRVHLEAYINELISLGYNKTTLERISLGERNYEKSNGIYLATNFSTTNPLSIGFRFLLGK